MRCFTGKNLPESFGSEVAHSLSLVVRTKEEAPYLRHVEVALDLLYIRPIPPRRVRLTQPLPPHSLEGLTNPCARPAGVSVDAGHVRR